MPSESSGGIFLWGSRHEIYLEFVDENSFLQYNIFYNPQKRGILQRKS